MHRLPGWHETSSPFDRFLRFRASQFPLLKTLASHHDRQGIVRLVARILEHSFLRSRHQAVAGPGPDKRPRIVDGKLVFESVWAVESESFDDVQTRSGSAEVRLVGEVRGVD